MYNKLFTKILDSSIWMESLPTRVVWLTMLAAMDEMGYCHFASVANLAHRARVTLDEAKEAVARLEAPDAESSDPDHEGRRIERVPGGWIVLNATKYRDMATRVAVQAQTKERVRRFRATQRPAVTLGNALVTLGNAPLRTSNAPVTQSEAYTEAETDTETEKVRVTRTRPSALSGTLPRDHMDHGFCGTRFCVSAKVWTDMLRRYGAGGEQAVDAWLRSVDGSLGEHESVGGPLWILQRFDAWLVESGRVATVTVPKKRDGMALLREHIAKTEAASGTR